MLLGYSKYWLSFLSNDLNRMTAQDMKKIDIQIYKLHEEDDTH